MNRKEEIIQKFEEKRDVWKKTQGNMQKKLESVRN